MTTAKELYKDCFDKGHDDEKLVAYLITSCIGGSIEHASEEDDMFKHIDLWWYSPVGRKIGIDVKGKKKNSRKDNVYSNIHWIEAKNVNGDNGWIYGEAEFIAFLMDDSVMFVKRDRLVNLYEEQVKGKEIVHDNPKACLIPYQRNNRKDIIFKIDKNELNKIASFSLLSLKN